MFKKISALLVVIFAVAVTQSAFGMCKDNFKVKCDDGEWRVSAIHMACAKGDRESIERLMQEGCSFEQSSNVRETPLASLIRWCPNSNWYSLYRVIAPKLDYVQQSRLRCSRPSEMLHALQCCEETKDSVYRYALRRIIDHMLFLGVDPTIPGYTANWLNIAPYSQNIYDRMCALGTCLRTSQQKLIDILVYRLKQVKMGDSDMPEHIAQLIASYVYPRAEKHLYR